MQDTSIWTASVAFRTTSPDPNTSGSTDGSKERDPGVTDGFWNDPNGNPTPEPDKWKPYSSPWRRSRIAAGYREPVRRDHDHDENTKIPDLGEVLIYDQPIHYEVKKTGYYCIGTIPVTVLHEGETRKQAHASFTGNVLFRNSFDGYLAATDHPKITFYMVMMLVSAGLAAAWGLQCMRHRHDLLPIQNYISALFGLVVIEMLANWTYYRYLNAHGPTTASKVFLFVVSILDAARNSLSFFLLLIVSLGLGVVKEELEEMNKCRALGIAHAIFGVLYAIGMDLVELETVSALLLLAFVVPLAFTMTAFLLWIMYGLTGTIAELAARKQKYKLGMFKSLYRVLMLAVIAIAAFFVISSLSFSNRYDEDYAPSSWKSRWWLLDGWMVLLYLFVFVVIAFLWRPTGSNRRLAMSDELAQDEEDAEDYDLETIQERGERAKMEAMAGIDDMGNGSPPEGEIRLRGDDDV
ncbi:hypothetical protein FRC02_000489 [Tulasnella sp. 418]|nr:hypothetical protein FRC02_000489 [Tulasnella sp. 418]